MIAIDRGKGQAVGGDFHVFWQAGRNFASGAPLYHSDLPGARRYIYPPFAAMVFQLLAVFPLSIAAEILSFVNLLLLGVAIALTKRIIEQTLPDRATGPLPLVLGVALSLVFFLDNFSHVQINEVIFVLALLGVDAHVRGWEVRSSASFVLGSASTWTPHSSRHRTGRPRSPIGAPPSCSFSSSSATSVSCGPVAPPCPRSSSARYS